MGLTFLAPLFLAGLALIAIPIIVHLTHKQKDDTVRFPSLMFVRRVPYKTTQKQRIRDWLLFLMRCAALILIAAAFARPFLEKPIVAAGRPGGARDVVVLLDRSYSMAYEGRWQRAQAAALDAIGGIGSGDRATLVLFDQGTETVRGEDGGVARLRNAIDNAKPGSAGTRYAPALKQAQSLLELSDRPRKEVVLISDFQKAAWSTGERMELPVGAELKVVDTGSEAADNIAVAQVTFEREVHAGRERVSPRVRVVNRSGRAASAVPVTLTIDDREIEQKRIDIPADGSATVEFAPFTLMHTNLRGVVTAGDDPLPIDNRHYFVLTPGQAVSVVIAERGVRASESLYLERALGISREPAFRIDRRGGPPTAGDISTHAVVVLNDVGLPGGAAGRLLRQHVENGGGLLVILGPRTEPGAWRGDGVDLLPGSVGRIIEREPGADARIAWVDYTHSVFEPFRSPRTGDFASARFYRYRVFDPSADARVLARFDDGRPALVEGRTGRGRVLVFTAMLDNIESDLAVQPVFLPFTHQVIRHLASFEAFNTSHTAGTVLDVGATGGTAKEMVAVTPSGDRIRLGGTEPTLLELKEQGFYHIRPTGADAEATTSIAVNVNLDESDLTRMDPDVVRTALTEAAAAAPKAADPELTIEEQEQRQSGWWYLLVIALGLLAAETVLSNRLSRIARS